MKLLARIDALITRLAKNGAVWFFSGLLLVGGLAVFAYHEIFPSMPEPAVYASLDIPGQRWTPNWREKYYQTSQGNPVVPFTWFMSLERQPQGFPPGMGEVDLFSSPRVQARYGLLPDTSQYNPYQLPVGIVKDVLSPEVVELLGQGHKEWIGMSCAACHTGQIIYKGEAVRIDGGQAMWNFSQWSSDMVSNLMLTAALPERFERFAKRVFRLEHKRDTQKNRKELRESLETYLASPLIKDAIDALLNHTYPVVEGNARTAALGRGVNGEFGLLDQRNIVQNRGPVSFPPLWFTHDYDWVQSVAAIQQPMGRNITEAWGVNVQVWLEDDDDLYLSTARLHDMFWMETALSVLSAPEWPVKILPPVDMQKAKRGRYLYEKAVWDMALSPAAEQLPPSRKQMIAPANPARPRTGYCARCHAPAPLPRQDEYGGSWQTEGSTIMQLPLYRQEVMNTDPYDAQEFNARKPYTGQLAGQFDGKTQVGVGEALTVIVSGIQERWYTDRRVPETCQDIMNGFRPNAFRAPLGYPARPMEGYWATGPFLHNGSVRTLYQLLSPVEEREKTFYTGTFEFDPVHLGYTNERIDGAFLYDTSVPGNYNTGHEFRDAPRGTPGVIGPYLSREDRLAIIEYMKVMKDVTESNLIPPRRSPRGSALLQRISPFYERLGYKAVEGPEPMAKLCAEIEGYYAQPSGGQSYNAAPAAGASDQPQRPRPRPRRHRINNRTDNEPDRTSVARDPHADRHPVHHRQPGDHRGTAGAGLPLSHTLVDHRLLRLLHPLWPRPDRRLPPPLLACRLQGA